MNTRTKETIAAVALPVALGIGSLIWRWVVGPPDSHILLAAVVFVIAAEFGIARRRWKRGEKA